MTTEEIKRTYSMTDVLQRYGLRPNRAGFIKCPFHTGDHTASMKIYTDNFYCYGCGLTGDVFKFVMLMDNIPFKEAFYSLGGEYPKEESRSERIHRKRDLLLAKQKREREAKALEDKRIQMHHLSDELNLLIRAEKYLEPMSEEWCYAVDKIPQLYGEWLRLWEEVIENRQE